MPSLRRRRVSREPGRSRWVTISFVRSPAIRRGMVAEAGGCVLSLAVFEDLLRQWDGEEAVVRFDRASGAWMFVCIHSTVLGPAGGGTRMRVYGEPSDGLADAMRLSAAMTRKMAVADVPRGGGKAVLAVPELPEGDAGGSCSCGTASSSSRSAARTRPPAT